MATASSRKRYAAGESILYFLVVIGILVVANVLGIFGIFARSDWTEADLFTLSEGSRRLAREIDDRMEIRAYFTEDMPNPEVERYARDILTEYEEASNGNIHLTIINPDEEAEKEAAEEDGLTRMQLPDYSEDEFSVKEGYRGIAIE